jgi:hypothetical protein
MNRKLIKITGSIQGLDVNTNIQSSSINDAIIYNPTFSGNSIFTVDGSGILPSHIGLSNVDNTSDLDKPISTLVQQSLDAKLPINNPEFTGLLTGTDIEIENIHISGVAKINTTLQSFSKIFGENTHRLNNSHTNAIICGNNTNIILLPESPIDGMTVNISNMSSNDLFVHSNNKIYNLFIALNGLFEIILPIGFMYTFIYTSNSDGIGHWNCRF